MFIVKLLHWKPAEINGMAWTASTIQAHGIYLEEIKHIGGGGQGSTKKTVFIIPVVGKSWHKLKLASSGVRRGIWTPGPNMEAKVQH